MRKAFAIASLLVTPSCAGFWHWPFDPTQRWPGPMEALADPLPRGDADLYPPGPEEVLVLRHADPVQVRPAGLSSGFPLSFYNKDMRVVSGSAVYAAPGGRIEVLWPSGTSVVLFGRGAGVIGSQSRGEPSFIFRQIERATVDMKSEDQVELVGGAQLSAHSGPFILDHFQNDILRVKNQSKAAGEVAFRDAIFVLDPGQVIDLPLLSAGGKPDKSDAGLKKLDHPTLALAYTGTLDISQSQNAVLLHAREGDSEVRALGVRVRMHPGESVRFSGLARAEPVAPLPVQAAPPAGEPSTPDERPPAQPIELR